MKTNIRKAGFLIQGLISIIVLLSILPNQVQAQVPKKFGYQAVARNLDGVPLSNSDISVRFTIYNLFVGGAVLYSERHNTTTTALGLFNLEVGSGFVLFGNFSNINWASGAKFLEISLDPNGDTDGYTFTLMGTTELISVPFALMSDETKWISISENNIKVGNSNYPLNGVSNTAVGKGSLDGNTSGYYNVAIGHNALFSNTIGYSNCAEGYHALYSNNSGYYNTAVGNSAAYNSSTGFYNSAFGSLSLLNNTTGSNNTAIGLWALSQNTTTSGNTAIGFDSADNTIGTTNCTFLGRQAGFNGIDYTNSTALGYNSPMTANNQIRLGNPSVTSIGGYANYTNISDQRFKTNVQPNVAGLDFILQLRPVTYRLDAEGIDAFLRNGYTPREPDEESDRLHREGLKNKSSVTYTGFLAQEVEAAAQKTGFDFSGVDVPQNERDLYGLRYAEFVVPLVKAVQEQQAMIETLREKADEVDILKAENQQMKTENQQMKAENQLMQNEIDLIKAQIGLKQ